MNAMLRIVLGGIFGFLCYAAMLWVIGIAVPRLGLGGDELQQAILWPTKIYLYALPKTWADTPTEEILMTFLGSLIILRGMLAGWKRQPQPA